MVILRQKEQLMKIKAKTKTDKKVWDREVWIALAIVLSPKSTEKLNHNAGNSYLGQPNKQTRNSRAQNSFLGIWWL